MIMIITYLDEHDRECVDYGFNTETDMRLIMPQDPIAWNPNIVYDIDVGCYKLKEETE